MGADPAGRLLDDAVQAVENADSLDAALAALARVLLQVFPIKRLSVRTLSADGHRVNVAGLWTDSPSTLGVGTTMSVGSTSFLEVMQAGSAVVGGDSYRLLDRVLSDEGVRSWVTVPLRSSDDIVAMISFSSGQPRAFSDEEAPFFDALIDRIASRLTTLLKKAR